MPWWGWIGVGVGLLVLEVLVQTEFWLTLIGAAAMGVGVILLTGLPAPMWVQWAIFGVLSLVMLTFVRRSLHEKLVGTPPGIAPELVGDTGTAVGAIAPGATGSVSLRGTTWQARNAGSEPISDGESVHVERVDGLVLWVRGS